MTWVKICATTNLPDAQAGVAAGADALGFIFAPSARRIKVQAASEIIALLPAKAEKIGIFVNETPADIAAIAGQAGLTGVQLHGDEPPESHCRLPEALGKRKIIKTLQARELLAEEETSAPRCLSEGGPRCYPARFGSAAQRGGTGIPFDWEKAVPIAAAIRRKRR